MSGIILVAEGHTGLVVVVNNGSGGKQLDNVTLAPGSNLSQPDRLTAGKVSVEAWDGGTMLGGGYGTIEVSERICERSC